MGVSMVKLDNSKIHFSSKKISNPDYRMLGPSILKTNQEILMIV